MSLDSKMEHLSERVIQLEETNTLLAGEVEQLMVFTRAIANGDFHDEPMHDADWECVCAEQMAQAVMVSLAYQNMAQDEELSEVRDKMIERRRKYEYE